MAKGGSVALHSCCGEVRSEELLTIQRKRRASAEQLAHKLMQRKCMQRACNVLNG